MTPVAKPALLRQLFGLAVTHPAQILSYQKMLGQLQDAGNTTTLASYLKLLSSAFLVTALEKWSGSKLKQKGSIPKLLVMDNALISAMSGYNFNQAKKDGTFWGRMLENAVGARLFPLLQEKGAELLYWRQRQEEVDYVIKMGGRSISLEVKSGAAKNAEACLRSFSRHFANVKPVLISKNKEPIAKGIISITVEQFFNDPKIIFN
jgi:predicted AAA+ superfamily ATPase